MQFSPDRKLFLLFVFLVGTHPLVYSQQSDFQFWPQVQVGYNLSKDFKVSLEEEVRFRENVSQVRKELTDFGITYRLNKSFRFSLNYRLELAYKNPDQKAWRNGLYVDIMFRQKIQRLQADYRIRFQSPKIESFSEVSTLQQWMTNRHKASLKYNIKGIPVTPGIEAEIFIPVGKQQPFIIDEYRLWAGLSYALNKKNEIGIKYGILREINVADPLTAYILTLNYSVDIN